MSNQDEPSFSRTPGWLEALFGALRCDKHPKQTLPCAICADAIPVGVPIDNEQGDQRGVE